MDEAVFWSWVITGQGGLVNVLERRAEDGRVPPPHHLEEFEKLINRQLELLERWQTS
jgi:hypothetical protein